MSTIEDPTTETYQCNRCGSVFKHHQLFPDEIIKCPSCGSDDVEIQEGIEESDDSDTQVYRGSSSHGHSLVGLVLIFGPLLLLLVYFLPSELSIITTSARLSGISPQAISLSAILLPLGFLLVLLVFAAKIFSSED